jgi:hypothetical protein
VRGKRVRPLHTLSITFTDFPFSKRDGQKLSSWNAPIYLIEALERRYGGPQGGHPQEFADDSEHKTLQRKTKLLSTMYDWLECLAGQYNTFGALGIAEAVLFLWKEHFELNPLYEQVTALLFHNGSKQQGWFPTAKHKLPLTEALSGLHVSSSLPCQMMVGLHLPEIVEINNKAVECISNTLAKWKEVRKSHLMQTNYRVACDEIAGLVYTQNSLIDENVRDSPLTQLSRMLKVKKLVTNCETMAEIIKMDEYHSDKPKEKISEDLALLRFYLQQLISN